MQFTELYDMIRAEESAKRQSLRPIAEARLKNMAKATELWSKVCSGEIPRYRFKEAMSTSDFPLMFSDTIARELLGAYEKTKPHWGAIARRSTVPDFREVKRFYIDGADNQLARVDEQESYPVAAVTEGSYPYRVYKYGREIRFSWEAMINDDLDALKNMPTRLGEAVVRSIERWVTSLYCGATGPISPFYTASNTVPGNPVLSLQSLSDAVQLLKQQVDANGEPIAVEAMHLVVGPALSVTAKNLQNMLVADLNQRGGSTNSRIQTSNWLAGGINIIENPYIPIVASSANGDTSWWVFSDSNISRPAMEVGFLAGYEQPNISMKAPDSIRIGGGANVMDGDFLNDSICYRVRHVWGGRMMDNKSTVASNGSGVS